MTKEESINKIINATRAGYTATFTNTHEFKVLLENGTQNGIFHVTRTDPFFAWYFDTVHEFRQFMIECKNINNVRIK